MTVRGLALALVFLFASAAPAHAAHESTVIAEHADEITQYAYRGSEVDAPPGPCGPGCTELQKRSERLALDQRPVAHRLRNETRVLRWRGGLKNAFRAFGRVALPVGGAFGVGFTLGTAGTRLWEAHRMPGAPDPSGNWIADGYRLTAVSQGDLIFEYFNDRVYAPDDGWVVEIDRPGSESWDTRFVEADRPGPCSDDKLPALPEGAGWLLGKAIAKDARCSYSYYWYPPPGQGTAKWVEQPAVGFMPANQRPPVPWDGIAAPLRGLATLPDPGYAAARDRILAELHNNPGRYPTLLPHLDNANGGESDDPTGMATVPDCRGETAGDCTAILRAAGFTGIEPYTLAPDDLVPEVAPDRVVATSPAAGRRAATSGTVRVGVNPELPRVDDENPRDENCEPEPRFDPGVADSWAPASPPFFDVVAPGGTLDLVAFYSGDVVNWGWRHIALKHGWSARVEAQVQDALRLVDPPGASPLRQTDGTYMYYTFYTDYLTGAQCTRVVVAEFHTGYGQPRPRGVMTTWATDGWNTPTPR